MELGHYLEMLRVAEEELAATLRTVSDAHGKDPDVHFTGGLAAGWADRHAEALAPFCERYAESAPEAPDELHPDLFKGPRQGGIGMLRDLHDLFLMASSNDVLWTLIGQAAKANRDEALLATVEDCEDETARTLQWLETTLKIQAAQALVVS